MDSYNFLKWLFRIGSFTCLGLLGYLIFTKLYRDQDLLIKLGVIFIIWAAAVAAIGHMQNKRMGVEYSADKWKKDFDIKIKEEADFDIIIKENGDE